MQSTQTSKLEETSSALPVEGEYNVINNVFRTFNNIDITSNSNSASSCMLFKLEVINKTENNEELITPENFYVQKIYLLANVRAIVCEEFNDVLHFITILDSRNLETREAIYEVELKMFDLFENQRFSFLTVYFKNLKEFNALVQGKHKKILYYSQ